MKAKIYSHNLLIGTSELQIGDESMGCVFGEFLPNEHYFKNVQKYVWEFWKTNKPNYEKWNSLRFNVQLENGYFVYAVGGYTFDDSPDFPDEQKRIDIAGIDRHVIEYFFQKKPTDFFVEEPWENLSIEQKISFEDELNKATKYDSVFEMVVTKFYNEARFSQRIKLLSDNATITGVINYMTCDDEQCIFKPDNPFLFQISASGETSAQQTTGEDIAIDNTAVNKQLYGIQPEDILKLDTTCEGEITTVTNGSDQSKSLWSIFGLGFLGGLLALLTPCVFPMIPLTVSFFTKKNSKKG